MAASIQRYKFSEQVWVDHLNYLAQAKNELKTTRESVKTEIRALEGKLKWAEDTHASMAARIIEQVAHFEDMVARL